ncbi:MAG: hypothetical protein ACRCUX_06200, partial [Beijerinckiaceae bacterium]
MVYTITFNYYRPGHINPVTGHPVSAAGHANVTFNGLGGVSTYGMNTDASYGPGHYVAPTDFVDGIFGAENYGNATASYTIEVSELTYQALLAQAQAATDTPQNYNLFLNSCITYANSVYIAAGGQGHLIDQILPQLSPTEYAFLLFAHPSFLQHAGLLSSILLAGVVAGMPTGFIFGFALGITALRPVLRDPLILDLDGDGIELTALGVAGEAGA